jgi:hypothetical protein
MDDAEQERIKDFTRRKHSGIFFFLGQQNCAAVEFDRSLWKYSFPEMKPS